MVRVGVRAPHDAIHCNGNFTNKADRKLVELEVVIKSAYPRLTLNPNLVEIVVKKVAHPKS